MSGCHGGYFCRICGSYVRDVTESELYLRYVLGEVAMADLFDAPEAHIRCVPEIAQYIVDEEFEPAPMRGAAADKAVLDPDRVSRREARVTRAWRRLQEIPGSGLDIAGYPLP